MGGGGGRQDDHGRRRRRGFGRAGEEVRGRRAWRVKERRGGSGAGGGARAYVAAGVEGDDACNIPKNSPK